MQAPRQMGRQGGPESNDSGPFGIVPPYMRNTSTHPRRPRQSLRVWVLHYGLTLAVVLNAIATILLAIVVMGKG